MLWINRGAWGYVYAFLTSTPGKCEWLSSRPGHLNSRVLIPCSSWIRSNNNLTARLGNLEQSSSILLGIKAPKVQIKPHTQSGYCLRHPDCGLIAVTEFGLNRFIGFGVTNMEAWRKHVNRNLDVCTLFVESMTFSIMGWYCPFERNFFPICQKNVFINIAWIKQQFFLHFRQFNNSHIHVVL